MIRIKTRYTFAMLLLICMVSGAAMAKDNVLEQMMIDLERAYIPALFLTSQVEINQNVTPNMAKNAMSNYAQEWGSFSDEYSSYRSSYRNWISYFDQVQKRVNVAMSLVNAGQYGDAHEELEHVRTTMRELRRRNGFPKFITDELTAFHSIMGEIIAISNSGIDSDTIDILYDLYGDASHAWFKVDKNTVDQMWGLTPDEMIKYNKFVQKEWGALDAFKMALDSGVDIVAAANGLKPPQAGAYLLLGGISK